MAAKEAKPKNSNSVARERRGKKGVQAETKTLKVSTAKTKKLTRPAALARAGGLSPASKEDDQVVLRIRVRAYESKILDASVKQIMDTAVRYDAEVVGPVPLPTEIKKYTVNRASFIYKNTREQFEIRVHKRLIDIINPNPKTVEALTNLSLPSGVDIDVKML